MVSILDQCTLSLSSPSFWIQRIEVPSRSAPNSPLNSSLAFSRLQFLASFLPHHKFDRNRWMVDCFDWSWVRITFQISPKQSSITETVTLLPFLLGQRLYSNRNVSICRCSWKSERQGEEAKFESSESQSDNWFPPFARLRQIDHAQPNSSGSAVGAPWFGEFSPLYRAETLMRSFTDISLCSRASVGIFLQMFINLGVFITLARGTLGSNRFQVSELSLNFEFVFRENGIDVSVASQLSIFLAIAVVMAVIGVKWVDFTSSALNFRGVLTYQVSFTAPVSSTLPRSNLLLAQDGYFSLS